MIQPDSIPADSLYDESAIKFTLGVSPAALAEGRRSGKLRFSRIGKRVFYRGKWLLDWFDAAAADDRKAVSA